MTIITDYACQADGCDHDAAEIVMTDDDEAVLLCGEHANPGAEWHTVSVNGRVLIYDTAGSWFFIPDAPEFTLRARPTGAKGD